MTVCWLDLIILSSTQVEEDKGEVPGVEMAFCHQWVLLLGQGSILLVQALAHFPAVGYRDLGVVEWVEDYPEGAI
jgi:hypothetical protein